MVLVRRPEKFGLFFKSLKKNHNFNVFVTLIEIKSTIKS